MFKGLKDAFFETDESSEEVVSKPAKVSASAPARPYQPIATATVTTGARVATANGKIKETLTAELQAKLAGSTYLQFQKVSSAMKTKIADPRTRVVAAGASLEAQGVSKQSIIDGANSAISFLTQEGADFQQAVTLGLQQLDSQLLAKTQEIEAALKARNEQILKISDEINALQKEKSQLEVDIRTEKTKLETNKIEFDGTQKALVQEIQSEINDINQYLGA